MTYYEILEVETNADFQTLKKAYYKQAKKCHPDHFSNSPEKTEEFKRLVEAFTTLSNPDARAAYDRRRKTGDVPGSVPAVFSERNSVMDTGADDTLEELVVGNRVSPDDTSLSTLFLDMRRTEIFIAWRSAETLYRAKRYREACAAFQSLTRRVPNNILYRVFLARSYAKCGKWNRSVLHYRAALKIGERRSPPQTLFRVRRELEKTVRKASPFLHRMLKLFFQAPSDSNLSEDERMISQTNRVIAAMENEQKSLPE